MTETTDLFVPPAAEGLPPGALDSATDGASALDASARTPYGRNLLAHALARLDRDGWLRPAPAVVPSAPADRAAALSEAERTMLAYALDQAQERIWSDDGFTDEDQAAVDSLKRLAGEEGGQR